MAWWSGLGWNGYQPVDGLGADLLDENPQAAWSLLGEPVRRRGGNFWDWWQKQGTQYYNRYLGELATGAAAPSQTFYGWGQGQGSNLNPLSDYQGLSPQERGVTPGRYLGRMSWRL